MMELSRQEYPALLRSLAPNQAISILDERVKLIGRINLGIADWLAERGRVEDAYVQGLRKLANRGSKEVSSELGVFHAPWHSILRSTETLANSHGVLAQKIEADVERPLKEFQTRNREMQAIGGIQGNLASIAKDLESAQKKASKLSGAKTSANKIANATSGVEVANQQWDSQAPYVFEQLQALDESRVNHLRDVLTQLETHEADQAERNRATTEACLNAILNIRTEEEISTFVARQTTNAPNIPERQASRNRTGSSAGATGPPSEVPAPAATPARRHLGNSSEASPYSTASSKLGPPPSSKKAFSGLRRLGTVLSRDKGSKALERPLSPEKRSRTGRNPLRRGPSSRQDMEILESPPQSSSSNIAPQAPQLADTVIRTDTRDSFNQASTLPPTQRDIAQTQGLNLHPPRQSSMPMANGMQATPETPTVSDQVPSSRDQNFAQSQKDAEGYNVAPNAAQDITRAQEEAAAVGDGDQSQLKLNIQDAPIRDGDDAAQQSAFSTVANTLRSQAAPARKATSARGRRDVRNTVFIPAGQSPESAGLGNPPTPRLPFQPISMPSDANRGSDAQSVRSAHSVGSAVNAIVTHPQMHQPGLNASIVETVSATLQQGKITKAVVIGEMALQHNAPENAASPSSESVRLENFPVLEKVAPNPVFITQKPSTSGEYTVNLSHTTRPAVAFKYQLHLDESNMGSPAPLSLTPNWKFQPTQASVILSYALNPIMAAAIKRSVTLRNLVISINVEGTKASSCQSKPAGIFSKEKSLIYWKLNEVTLDENSNVSQRLLARFNTESEAKPGNVEARWEISGGEAVGLGSGLALSQAGGTRDGSGGSDPFADEDTMVGWAGAWKDVPVTRKIMSGKYIAS